MRLEKTDEYRDWIDGLKDLAGRARILMRVDRLVHGNPGPHRRLTDGVSELKVDVGPLRGLLDSDAERLSLDDSVNRVEAAKARLVVFVVYGQNPNSGTTSMIGAVHDNPRTKLP